MEKQQIDYEQILLRLRRRTETASKLFLATGGLNVWEYSLALSESVLEALDAALCYPNIDILENLIGVVEVEKNE